jgi:hypothetical protein
MAGYDREFIKEFWAGPNPVSFCFLFKIQCLV